MATVSESALNYAGRQSNHPFADLRSARRSQNRTRTRNNKYNSFLHPGPTRADLASSPNQQAHYLPVCHLQDCPKAGTHDECWWNIFPADLSTAPIAKFTKREAYEEAQRWPRPWTYNSSREKRMWNCGKWETRMNNKRELRKELGRKEYVDDHGNMAYEDWWWAKNLQDRERYGEANAWWKNTREERTWWQDFPHSRSTYPYQHEQEIMETEETDEGYGSSEEVTQPSLGLDFTWHRDGVGRWFRADPTYVCTEEWCSCSMSSQRLTSPEEHTELPLPRNEYSLAEWLGELFAEEDEEGSDDASVSMIESVEGLSKMDGEWDILSIASEAWTEVGDWIDKTEMEPEEV